MKPDGRSALLDLHWGKPAIEAHGRLSLEIPLWVKTGDNRRGHAIAQRERIERERDAVRTAWTFHRWPRRVRPLEVALTRLAPRRIDAANLGSAFKAVIDQVAAELGVNDREFVLDDAETGIPLRLRQERARLPRVRVEVVFP